ncbi:Ig-like domain-containing protein, partial [Obesumbacterium proteus]|uniref:Ig-like domain-containing protein n=1 Tax=Obesumbacterium proteus TaxID=82983 RepID=UPI001F1F0296
MEDTIAGLQTVVDGGMKDPIKPPPESSPFLERKKEVPSESQSYPHAWDSVPSNPAGVAPDVLPSLGSPSTSAEPSPAETPDMSSQAVQAGQILSSDNVTDASINYAKSLGEGLINQEINDWLNQKGTARVSVGSDKKISGDLLLPVIDGSDHLLFTQLGLHGNEDRNTTNIGLGYRQYVDDWMYGVNTFYDYDYTGKNARMGVGGEAWTDYLKLAVNGYYGITDWHQSKLSSMKDYDERPANGFDLRADAYLPSYPQLGANLKYEQYFGKGIDLGTGTDPDDLKDNPKALTVGLNYTPIPLVTVKGEHSVGDKNDSRVGIDFNYRFGVPWAQQISSDAVDTMRSLMGSMYEFVDRNYEIVMQYRKQDLLHISLPAVVTASAAETITLPLAVTKAKYGLKSVNWTASAAFLAHGGTFRQLSLTQLEVTLPAYVYTRSAAQEYSIKAVGVDNNGNNSNVAQTVIRVEQSKNVVSDLTITPSGTVPANDTDYFTVTATVHDEHNNPMVAQAIAFDIDNMKDANGHSAATLFKGGDSNNNTLTVNTNNMGKATVFVRSKLAKEGVITATMNNGNYKSGQVEFIADATTARISALDVIKNKAFADGKSSDTLQATVTDINGNPLANAQIALGADHGASIVNGSTIATDTDGHALFFVTNTAVGDSTVTASLNGSNKNQVVTFIADKSTAQIAKGDLSSTQDAVANGSATDDVTAKITDTSGNLVSGATVHFTVSNGAKLTTITGITGVDGLATAKVTSLKAATYTVTARIQESGNSAQTTSRFIADPSTATIIGHNLQITPNGVIANGKDIDGVEATVTDANGNVVPGMAVSFVIAPGASITTLVGTTGADGKAKASATSTVVGAYKVTASVSGHSVSETATFAPDGGSATIRNGALTVTTDKAKANGADTNAVKAIVTDANSNVIPGAVVTFSANNGARVTVVSATTDSMGQATTTLTNTAAGVSTVTAKINNASPTVDTTFMPDSSTATIENGALTVTTDKAKSNGTDANTVKAVVTDAYGNVVPGATVNFSATHGATVATAAATTDANGEASTTLTNTVAGVSTVTAKINSANLAVDTHFVPDNSTATLAKGALTVTADKAKADGTDANAVKAVVTDANNNRVPGAIVAFSATNGATVTTASVTTDTNGEATTTLTSIAAGVSVVTATVNQASLDVNTQFVPDSGTVTIAKGALTVTKDKAKANGTEANAVKAVVTDANSNRVPGAVVAFSATNGATVAIVSVTTDANGEATTTLTNTTAGASTVTAKINNVSQMVDTTFIPDSSTATIANGALTITVDNMKANGTDANAVQAIVTDAYGNVIPSATVAFSAGNGATVTTASATTDGNGVATTTLTNTMAGVSTVTAAIGNAHPTVDTHFLPDNGTATIVQGALTVTTDKAKANGSDTNAVKAIVTDANSNVVPGAVVEFSADNGATVTTASATTDGNGVATTTLTNTSAGVSIVTAKVNTTHLTVDTHFMPDGGTATIIAGALTVTTDKAKANGTDANAVKAIVTDAYGNLVPGAVVAFSATNGATVTTVSATADGNGEATTTLTNTTAGVSAVTAKINTTHLAVDTHFMPDDGTATIIAGALTVTTDKAKANGTDTNAVKAIVTDANSNVVPGAVVTFSANNGATVTTVSATTDGNGEATTTLTNITAGVSIVTAAINQASLTVDTHFIPDNSTATLAKGALTVVLDNAVANGKDTNTVQAVVTDAKGNRVPGEVVAFSANNGATVITASVTTDANGEASTTLTNITAGVSAITATVGNASLAIDTHFVPDGSTTTIVNGALTITSDKAKANGTDTNAVKAIVTDANNNVVAGAIVNFSANNGATVTTAAATTDGNGVATTTLTNTRAGISTVTAKISGAIQTVDTTFIPDDSTATIIAGALTVTKDKAKADGADTNAVKVVVKDANGNVVPGVPVDFGADNGATVTTATVTTDTNGEATTTLTNITSGVSIVTATVNSVSLTVDTHFIPDSGTATIIAGALTVTVDNMKANGTDANAVKAVVKDANGNLVPGVNVDFSATNGATVTTAAVTTDANGEATTTLTNTTAGVSAVTAKVNNVSLAVDTHFIPDDSTATIIAGALTVTVDNMKANGTDANEVQAIVTDANSNVVPGAVVTFSANNGATVTT